MRKEKFPSLGSSIINVVEHTAVYCWISYCTRWNVFIILRLFLFLSFFSGFLTLPTAYVTGNPVECVVHPQLWNTSDLWDPLAVGKMYQDEYEEENVGYPIGSVSIPVNAHAYDEI